MIGEQRLKRLAEYPDECTLDEVRRMAGEIQEFTAMLIDILSAESAGDIIDLLKPHCEKRGIEWKEIVKPSGS